MNRRYRIHVARDEFKFSCAHMTVFPDGRKERLHGHNYRVAVALELADISFSRMVEFQTIKQAIGSLCAEWKERVLIARENPFLEILRDDGVEFEFRLCGQRYVLPAEDVLHRDELCAAAQALHQALASGPAPAGAAAARRTTHTRARQDEHDLSEVLSGRAGKGGPTRTP